MDFIVYGLIAVSMGLSVTVIVIWIKRRLQK